MPELAKISECTGCMGCMNVCPKDAISAVEQSDGHMGVRVDPERCIECGLCEKRCPVVNGYQYGGYDPESDYYAAWSEDDTLRRQGATSGIFGTLAATILDRGGYVVGAVNDGLRCRYRMISGREELSQLQGSKYTASFPDLIYRDILSRLRQGDTVLFGGLPCHVAALLNYIPDPLKANLFTADIICGGVASPLLIKRYAEEHPDMTQVKSFRDKDGGWHPKGYRYNLKYLSADGAVHPGSPGGSRNLITDGFACELTDRESCYDCRFAFTHRKSDLTMGDLWGDTLFPDQHPHGVSAVLAHTSRGRQLLHDSRISLHPIEPRQVLGHNDRIFNGRSVKRRFPERLLFPRLIRRSSYSTLMRVYASDLRGAPWYWMPFALYRLVSFRIAEKIKKRHDRYISRQLIPGRS